MSRSPATTEYDLERLSSLFKLLSDRTRLNILMLLARGERNVSSLCEELHLPQPTVSHHLGLLRHHHVIANRRDGKQVFYALGDQVDLGDRRAVRIVLDNFRIEISAS